MSQKVTIAGVSRALPEHSYSQNEIRARLERYWAGHVRDMAALERLHRRVRVGRRHLALPLEAYDRPMTWGETNSVWIETAQDLGERAIDAALTQAGMSRQSLGAFLFVSITGIASPSIDARLMNRMNLSVNMRRMPLFGLGCVGGAAGLARAADCVRSRPGEAVLLLSVELCSLTFQRDDLSVANLISSGLFGDGAAAAIVVGDEQASEGPEIVATRSVFYPDTEEVMGWDISEKGFRIVLTPDVPSMARRHLAKDVDAFLEDCHLERRDISRWIAHPGGPKVLDAFQESLELPDGALDTAWHCLSSVGNLSSASVLLVLEEVMKNPPPRESFGLLLAMGPGFCSELVLLKW